LTPFHACLLVLIANATDPIDQFRRAMPPDMVNQHGYSDFTDPLGRFLDLLAAGAFEDAKSIQAQACAAWAATRKTSAFSGKFTIWNQPADLDAICPATAPSGRSN
jgi:hypothetical protein